MGKMSLLASSQGLHLALLTGAPAVPDSQVSLMTSVPSSQVSGLQGGRRRGWGGVCWVLGSGEFLALRCLSQD